LGLDLERDVGDGELRVAAAGPAAHLLEQTLLDRELVEVLDAGKG